MTDRWYKETFIKAHEEAEKIGAEKMRAILYTLKDNALYNVYHDMKHLGVERGSAIRSIIEQRLIAGNTEYPISVRII